MKNWAKIVIGAGAGVLALWLLSWKGAPPQEQPPQEQPLPIPPQPLPTPSVSFVGTDVVGSLTNTGKFCVFDPLGKCLVVGQVLVLPDGTIGGIYRRSGDVFIRDSFLYTLAGISFANDGAFSPDGSHLALAMNTLGVALQVRIRTGETKIDDYVKASSFIGGIPEGRGQGCAYDPSGTYLAVTVEASGDSRYVTVYRRNGGTYVRVQDIPLPQQSIVRSCAFDPTGTLLAVAHGAAVTVYSRSGDTFTKVTDISTPAGSSPSGAVAFDPTGAYLAVGCTNSPHIAIYKRSGNAFAKLPDPDILPPARVNSCAFDRTGQFLAAAHNSSPGIIVYARSGDAFLRMPDPSPAPGRTSYGCAFDPTGTYLAVAHGGSPFIHVYKKTG